ncbi:acyl carrier protein [Frondihabitans sp. VKM Ac-2883]|jgi:acyl carrier protein|uniref:acyl carrier protein n=1 Tax=Frondihabitans sp. VKM Ac-2883 TaxID=2783823 RepID=UPI00188A86E1|nr:acyl carrier protein [Frondihabitans sp. VKM Ac-2883]MBF4575747.1 acyl carrier protein [Frondihabitans sp. VKM Ac-2883]
MSDFEFLALCEYILDAAPQTLSLDDQLVDIGWDSLSAVEFIAHVDDRTHIVVDASALADSTTLNDVAKLTRDSA